MLHKTRGIAINYTKFAETSVVAKIYTEVYGIQSYLINSVRSKKGKNKLNMLQPLTLLDMVVYHKQKAGLQRLSEMHCSDVLTEINTDVRKSSIAFFLAEILQKTLHEEEPNKELFRYLSESIIQLDKTEEHFQEFHLSFLVNLTKYLGFFPQGHYSNEWNIFDLREGSFQSQQPLHGDFIKKETAFYFYKLITEDFKILRTIEISQQQKKDLLQSIIAYYHLHFSSFGIIKSQKILEQVFND